MAQTRRDPNRVISEEEITNRQYLFDKYVAPYFRMIYKLVIQYSFDIHNAKDNYNEVLTNMYRYIDTYDESKPIRTWLHIVTKRCVYDLENKRKRVSGKDNDDDIEVLFENTAYDDHESGNIMGLKNYRELYNDDILMALEQLKPSYRRAFLLQQAGYKLKEIVEIEYEHGSLKSKNIDTIKSRLFLARQHLQQLLTRDGERRKENK